MLDGITEGEEGRILGKRVFVDSGLDVHAPLDALNNHRHVQHLTFDPRTKVLLGRSGPLQLLVIDDAAFDGVDEQHATGLESTLADDPLRLDVESTNFRSADHDVLVGDDISARTQAVSVEAGTAVTSVGESEKGGTIPRLHNACSPVVEASLVGFHELVVLPCLWNHYHDRLGKSDHAIDEEEFEDVVESGRVRSAGFDDGVEPVEVFTEQRGLQDAFTSMHPVLVPTDGVDFA